MVQGAQLSNTEGKAMTISKLIGEYGTLYALGRACYKYTDCGPWIVGVTQEGREIYYEDPEARTVSPDQIVAIEIGSIVEGSDHEVGPYTATTEEEFWTLLDKVNFEAIAAWDEANMDDWDEDDWDEDD